MQAGTDVAVVGAGIVGLSTALALADAGHAVTIYERAAPGGAQSGGESRIFRHAHEDPRLVALAREAHERWRAWESRFGVELVAADGVIALGAASTRRLAVLEAAGVAGARMIEGEEVAERLPLLAPPHEPALLDEAGGVIRTRAAIGALVGALGPALVADDVLAVRPTSRGTVEVHAGTSSVERERVVVCAGRDTPRLARGVGLALPVAHAAHARLTFRGRGTAPTRLACLLDGSGASREPGAYGDPLPGDDRYAVGLHDVGAREDGSLLDAAGLADVSRRTVGLRRPGASRTRARARRRPALLGHHTPMEPRRDRGVAPRRAHVRGREQPLQARARARAGARDSRLRRRAARDPAPGGAARRGAGRALTGRCGHPNAATRENRVGGAPPVGERALVDGPNRTGA